MRLRLLLEHCGDLGIEVEWGELPPRRHGVYYDDRNLIVLNQACTRAQMTAALAHEVAHWLYRDTCSKPASERRASEYGAGLIITPAEYAEAERAVGPHPGAIARELGVTRHLVEAWRRWYARVHGCPLVVSDPDEMVLP